MVLARSRREQVEDCVIIHVNLYISRHEYAASKASGGFIENVSVENKTDNVLDISGVGEEGEVDARVLPFANVVDI